MHRPFSLPTPKRQTQWQKSHGYGQMPSEWGACVQRTLYLVVEAIPPNIISSSKLWQSCSNVDWLPLWYMQCYFQLWKDSNVLQCHISDYCHLISENRLIKKNCTLFMLSTDTLFSFMLTVLAVLNMKSKIAISNYNFFTHPHLPPAVKLLAPAPIPR
jgi:hypothetical protein